MSPDQQANARLKQILSDLRKNPTNDRYNRDPRIPDAMQQANDEAQENVRRMQKLMDSP